MPFSEAEIVSENLVSAGSLASLLRRRLLVVCALRDDLPCELWKRKEGVGHQPLVGRGRVELLCYGGEGRTVLEYRTERRRVTRQSRLEARDRSAGCVNDTVDPSIRWI